ncbi:MAG: lipopolysaccharide biosynthesis protein [Cyanobacteria bacterium P01_F01_bin.53]
MNVFVRALKWSFLSEIAAKAVQPLVFVVLARLLTPEDYGVVASATMVISFSQMFWEAGMGKAIIQYQGERNIAANAAFWVNNALGIVVAGTLVAISGVVANRIFHDMRVAPVLKVMALQVFLAASASIHKALLQKDMNFKNLFWVRLTTVVMPGLFSIPLAVYGMGYWALVAGTLTGQIVQVAMLWKMSPWKPSFNFDVETAKQLVGFGGWVAGAGLLGWFYIWADSLVVGMNLGAHDLGVYRIGNAFVFMIFSFIVGPIMPVLYSGLSTRTRSKSNWKSVTLVIQKALFMISLPIGLALFVFGNKVPLILGGQWTDASIVIQLLGLMQGLSWLMGVNDEIYKSMGRPDISTKIMGIALIYHIPAYYIGSQYGLKEFLLVRVGLQLVSEIVHFLYLKMTLDISFLKVVKNNRLTIGASMLTLLLYWLFHSGLTMISPFFEMLVYSVIVVIVNAPLVYLLSQDLRQVKRELGY